MGNKFVPNKNPEAKTVAYVRVSSTVQDHGMQRAAIERLATVNGDKIDQWIGEKASGKTVERPMLQELRQAVKEGQIKKVYIWRLDRLTRSGIADTLQIVEEFSAKGAELISVTDGFSLVGMQAEIILAVMAWASKMEREAINERVQGARKRMEAEGRPWGRVPVKFDTERAKALQASNMTIVQIAAELGVSKSVIGRALKRAA